MDVPHRNPTHGWIEVITGSMFSGKSEELIRRLRRAQIARQRVQIFKPAFDNRFAEAEIVSHSEMRIQGVNVGSSAELLRLVNDDTEVVGIDEAQFFDKDLPDGVHRARGRRQARRRGGTRHRLPRPAVRADADADGHRRVRHQDARDLHGVRQSGQPHPAAGGERRAAAAWCDRNVRGAVSQMLRPHIGVFAGKRSRKSLAEANGVPPKREGGAAAQARSGMGLPAEARSANG